MNKSDKLDKPDKPSVLHHTFVLERHYPYPPQKIFAAFSDPEKKRRWFAEGSPNTVEIFQLDFRVGGTERICSRFGPGTPFSGVTLDSEWFYLDIVENQRIISASWMALGERRISASLVTTELLLVKSGTDLILTHQAAFYEGSDGPEMRKHGWESLLNSLEKELSR